MKNIAIVTLFPEMFSALTDYGVTGRAVKQGLVKIVFINPRDFTQDRHHTVDDRPYGGGPGMVMKIEPLKAAIDDFKPDVIESNHIWVFPYLLAKLGYTYIASTHNSDQMGYAYDARMQEYAQFAAKNAQKIFCISDKNRCHEDSSTRLRQSSPFDKTANRSLSKLTNRSTICLDQGVGAMPSEASCQVCPPS